MGFPQILSLKELIFVQIEALGTEIWQNLWLKNHTFPDFKIKNVLFQMKRK